MTTLNKIEIYKELHKELQDRKMQPSKPYFEEDFLLVEHDATNNWIYADWRGYQTEGSVMAGCEKILEAMVKYNCSLVLNDNTHVLGIWTPAAAWVGADWFPRMEQKGLQKFAWVYSPSALSQVSTNASLKHTANLLIIRTFYAMEAAKQWLSATE